MKQSGAGEPVIAPGAEFSFDDVRTRRNRMAVYAIDSAKAYGIQAREEFPISAKKWSQGGVIPVRRRFSEYRKRCAPPLGGETWFESSAITTGRTGTERDQFVFARDQNRRNMSLQIRHPNISEAHRPPRHADALLATWSGRHCLNDRKDGSRRSPVIIAGLSKTRSTTIGGSQHARPSTRSESND